MTNALKSLIPLFFIILSCLLLQIFPLQAADNEVQEKTDVKGNKTMCVEEERHLAKMEPLIPPIAQGYEEVYRRFLNGALIYRPDPKSDVGMVTLPIRELTNPLKGTFDLSRCGDAGQCLSISTGYKKRSMLEDVSKVEVWICPRFLIEKKINTSASHFKFIMNDWNPPAAVGLFWTWGNLFDLSLYDYLTTQNMDDIANNNLYEKWLLAHPYGNMAPLAPWSFFVHIGCVSCFTFTS